MYIFEYMNIYIYIYTYIHISLKLNPSPLENLLRDASPHAVGVHEPGSGFRAWGLEVQGLGV